MKALQTMPVSTHLTQPNQFGKIKKCKWRRYKQCQCYTCMTFKQMAWQCQCCTCMTLKQMAWRRNSQFLWGIEVQSLDFIIINHSQIALPPPSTTSTCYKPSISRSPSNGNYASALLANCLMSNTDMSNAAPMENSNFSNFKSPEDYISLKRSKMDCLKLYLCTCKYNPRQKTKPGSSLGHL